jgi:hypothetical protein
MRTPVLNNQYMLTTKRILFTSIFLVVIGCNNMDNLYGHSKTKEEAKRNGSPVLEYLPVKNNYQLRDGDIIKIDTAWTEISFYYKNGERVLDSSDGFVFTIPFRRPRPDIPNFSLSLADTNNRVFTNGTAKDYTQIRPRRLSDTMLIALKQPNPDTSIGWRHGIVTDTIVFIRIK